MSPSSKGTGREHTPMQFGFLAYHQVLRSLLDLIAADPQHAFLLAY